MTLTGTNSPLEAAAISDLGKVRKRNEDAYVIDLERKLFIVSDGMGGANEGALASEIVTSVLPRMIAPHLDLEVKSRARSLRQYLRKTVIDLSNHLHNQAEDDPSLKGMGATVVLAAIRNRWVHIAHLGDSRAYIQRENTLMQLTEDHSMISLLLRQEIITPEEIMNHPAKGKILRFVGMPGNPLPEVSTLSLLKGDRLLLCTDGLTGMITDEEIKAILHSHPDLANACRALINAANNAGGEDNITAMIVNWR